MLKSRAGLLHSKLLLEMMFITGVVIIFQENTGWLHLAQTILSFLEYLMIVLGSNFG